MIDHSRLRYLPKSAQDVIVVLDHEMLISDIVEATGRPIRTIRFAIDRLLSLGYIKRKVNWKDMRSTLYFKA